MVSSTDPTFPLFPICAIFGVVLALIQLPWHTNTRNTGTCAYMIWVSLACFVSFVNSIVWAGNVNNAAPIWCDISSKILLGAKIGIPAAVLCTSRRLYNIISGSPVPTSRGDGRRMLLFDLCVVLGAPIIIMILHYIVQSHRFDILEDVGCFPVTNNAVPAYLLFFVWPILFATASFVFSVMTLHSLCIRRLQLSQIVSRSSPMTLSIYLRLLFLALIVTICVLPVASYRVHVETRSRGASIAHRFSWVDTVPANVWRSDSSLRTSIELDLWLPVVCALLFFALFGCSEEAQNNYRRAFWTVVRIFGVRHASPSPKDVSRTSFSGSKNLSHSHSFSTSTSASTSNYVGGAHFELRTYKPTPIHIDIEKLAELPLSSPTTTSGETLFGAPPGYTAHSKTSSASDYGSAHHPHTAATWSATTAMRISDTTPPPSPGRSSFNLHLHPLPLPPPRKPSASSIYVSAMDPVPEMPCVDAARGRVYVSPVPRAVCRKRHGDGMAEERAVSPPPFVNTADTSHEPEASSPIRNATQVMVLQTETTSS